MKSKKCPRCKTEKPLDEFGRGGFACYCKICCRTKAKEFRQTAHAKAYNNAYKKQGKWPEYYKSEKWKKYARNANLKRAYGITLDQYNQMLQDQDFRCGICRKHQSEVVKTLVVDHDHVTGMVRGLLCDLCNKGLGLFHDDCYKLGAAISYLKARCGLIPPQVAALDIDPMGGR